MTGNTINGELNYVEEFTEFSGETELQSGHYLVLRVTPTSEDAEVEVELVGGAEGSVVMLEDEPVAVIRVTDIETESVKVTVTVTNEDETEISSSKTYQLGLILKPEEHST